MHIWIPKPTFIVFIYIESIMYYVLLFVIYYLLFHYANLFIFYDLFSALIYMSTRALDDIYIITYLFSFSFIIILFLKIILEYTVQGGRYV